MRYIMAHLPLILFTLSMTVAVAFYAATAWMDN